jgi:hypothetical protein
VPILPASGGPGSPERADQFQPPSHRPAGTAELHRDLLDGVPLQFPDGDPPQVLVAQGLEEATILLGELGGGLGAGDPVEPGRLVGGAAGGQVGLGADPAASPLQPPRASQLVGGLANYGGTTTLTNCTVSGNSAGSNGGGLLDSGGTTTLTNCTVSGNSARYSGGLANIGGTTTLANTIVAANSTGSSSGPDAHGAFTSQGNNLIGETDGSSGWVSSDRTGTLAQPLNPLLAPLGNYGGPTQTMALLPGSPAIDAGNNVLIPAGVTTDQRGLSRIVDSAVDIGSFESQGFAISIVSGNNQSIAVNNPFDAPLIVQVTANNPLEPVAGGIVTFSGPTTGAGINPQTVLATIGTNGTASSVVTANGKVGFYVVSASAAGATPAAFILNNAALGVTQFAIGFGNETFVVSPNIARDLPWTDIRTLQRTFNGDASGLTLADFSLAGTRFGNYLTGATLSYFPSTRTITITLAPTSVIGSDAWAAVDGKIGDHLTFGFRGVTQSFAVLSGDYDGNGVVNLLDLNRVRQAAQPGMPYDIFADLNGDGVVDAADVALAQKWAGSVLR